MIATAVAENPARRPQRKSERTRRRILAAAKQLFDRRGYRDTTIDDITRRAEIAHGTFYLYFRGKGELLKELLEQTFIEFDQLASRPPMSTEAISELVRESLLTYQRNRLLMRMLREASAADPYFRSHYDEVFTADLVSHLQASIGSIQAMRGGSRPELDARAAARAIAGMIESFAYGMFIGNEPFDLDVAVETLSLFCSRAIGLA